MIKLFIVEVNKKWTLNVNNFFVSCPVPIIRKIFRRCSGSYFCDRTSPFGNL